MKFNFNPLRKFVTGAALLTATSGNAAEKPEVPVVDAQKNTTEYVTTSSSQTQAEALDFSKEQHRIALEGKKIDFENDIKRVEMLMRNTRTDFITRFNEIRKFQGESVAQEDTSTYLERAHNLEEKLEHAHGKIKVSDESVKYLPQVLIDAAMRKAQEHLGKKGVNITSDENIEGLTNMLLDEAGPLGSEIAKFDELLSEQLGSTAHGRLTNENTNEALDITSRDDRAVMEKRNVTKNSFGQKMIGSFNEDLDQHQALGKIAKESIKLGVTLADRKYKLDKVEKELEALMGIPDELAQN